MIYLAFISLGLPDALLGAAWPVLYKNLNVPLSFAGIITFIISSGSSSSRSPMRSRMEPYLIIFRSPIRGEMKPLMKRPAMIPKKNSAPHFAASAGENPRARAR